MKSSASDQAFMLRENPTKTKWIKKTLKMCLVMSMSLRACLLTPFWFRGRPSCILNNWNKTNYGRSGFGFLNQAHPWNVRHQKYGNKQFWNKFKYLLKRIVKICLRVEKPGPSPWLDTCFVKKNTSSSVAIPN